LTVLFDTGPNSSANQRDPNSAERSLKMSGENFRALSPMNGQPYGEARGFTS
jgi:hypothetical protein